MSVAEILAGFTVEIGLGVNAVGGDFFVLNDPIKGELNNTTYLLAPDTVFVDIFTDVVAIETKRGRERDIDEYNTGIARVVFNDTDRIFDPAYESSPYAGELVPMKRVRIAWQNIAIFTGWIEDWTVTYVAGDSLSRITLDCVDSFAILANQELAEIAPAFSGDLTGERIERVLDRDEIAYPASRDIDVGNTTLGATDFSGNALSYLQECSRAEAGYLFISAAGTLTFRNRLAVLNVPAGAVLSDDRTAGIPYRTVTQRSTSDLLFTRITGESETTGNTVVAEDVDGHDQFFVRTLNLGSLFSINDIETQNLVDHYLSRFSEPEIRFHSADINVASLDSGQVSTLLNLELTEIVSVQRSPLNVGPTIERSSIVDGVAHQVRHGGWMATVNFANADTRSFLTLNDAVLGELGANRLAF
jgi:hypothetical protein